jgi:hypothetical protein
VVEIFLDYLHVTFLALKDVIGEAEKLAREPKRLKEFEDMI